MKELFDFNETEALEQMQRDFEMMKQNGEYEQLFPQPTNEDVDEMFKQELEEMGMTAEEYEQFCKNDAEDFFVPETEDLLKAKKEMEEIPL